MLYQNYLREFLCTIMVEHPTLSTKASEARHLLESIIKFIVKYGKNPLTLNYQTFCQSMGLEYNNGNYVAHPSTKEVRVELVKIATHDVLVLGGNHSSTKQINSSQQLIIFSLCTGTKIDIREIIYNDLVTRLMAESWQTSIPPVMSQFFSKNPFEVTTIKLTVFMNDLISHETSVSLLLVSKKKGKKKTHTMTKPIRKSEGPEAFEALPQKGKKPSTDPQDIEGNIQPTVKGLPSTTDEDIRTSSLLSEAQPIYPNDSEGTYTRKMPQKKNNMSAAAIKRLISQRVADALLDYEENWNTGNENGNRNGNRNGSYDSRDGSRRLIVGHDAAYEMPWKTLMKMVTEAYCTRSEIKKLQTELWNLTVKVERKHGHYRSECPELMNRNRGNQARSSEARGRVYALGGGEPIKTLTTLQMISLLKERFFRLT
uniref:Reverse transcriptase domain-containing protein n=1 Tax=Tanacetum cinerariifolium TaxID=118510 RepID=A0A6L2L4T1_TANCI|nr:hypothetical protein [Tanacetum cinerariifolium]